MREMEIDFLRKKHQVEKPSRKRIGKLGRVILIAAIFCAVAASALSYQIASSGDGLGNNFPNLSFFSTIRGLVSAGDRQLTGEQEGRINFLLMGIGGEGHSGPQLTDTIIFGSFDPEAGKLGLISIPRDLTVPIPGHSFSKINHANAFGEAKEPGSGPFLATAAVENILGQKIHYYLRVDFAGFAQFVDDLGGLDIYVDRAFTDYQYPTHGREYDSCGQNLATADLDNQPPAADYSCRFEVLTFAQGPTHMNGDLALKYVRSRHGTNGEASDFARSRRQQKVLAAVKDKIFSLETMLNPARISRILETLSAHIATNLDTWELIRLSNQLKDLDTQTITSHVLDTAPDSPLYATSLNGSYVILPKNEDWRPLMAMAENIFEDENSIADIFTASGQEKSSFVKLEIQNGTNVTGLAFNTSQLLDGNGFEVVKIGNAQNRDFKQTVIYDLTNGQRPQELKALRDFLKAEVVLSAMGWVLTGDLVPNDLALTTEEFQALAENKNADFLIILGENSANLVRR